MMSVVYSDREREIRRITLWGALTNVVLTLLKFAAGIFGRSSAMIADGAHSLSDLISDVVVLVFTRISSREKDRDHSFGHGKFETLATLIVSVILISVGARLMAAGVVKITAVLRGESIPTPGYIALWAAAISLLLKEVLYHFTVRVGKKVNSPVVIANAWHHRSDALSSIGAFVGIGGAIMFGEKWAVLDPIASCGISIAIILVAVKMALPSLAELLEASLPEDVEAEILATVSSVDGVDDVHELKTRRNGISFIVDAHVVVDPDMSLIDAHDIATAVENALRAKFGKETQISIHLEPGREAE